MAANEWRRLSCGEGAQGPRRYDWAYVPARPALRDGWRHGVLVRRHPERTDDLAFYLVYAPHDTPLGEMVRAAGARWTIDDLFKLAKGLVGLDQYEVRSWHGWYRHITLALLAFATLTISARHEGGKRGGGRPVRQTPPPPRPRNPAAPRPPPLGRDAPTAHLR